MGCVNVVEHAVTLHILPLYLSSVYLRTDWLCGVCKGGRACYNASYFTLISLLRSFTERLVLCMCKGYYSHVKILVLCMFKGSYTC